MKKAIQNSCAKLHVINQPNNFLSSAIMPNPNILIYRFFFLPALFNGFVKKSLLFTLIYEVLSRNWCKVWCLLNGRNRRAAEVNKRVFLSFSDDMERYMEQICIFVYGSSV